MEADRIAEVPVRHHFRDYICTIGYSEYEGEFIYLGARFADPQRHSEEPKCGHEIYLRVLREPELRAGLLEKITPEEERAAARLRREAVAERGKNYGFWVGVSVYIAGGGALFEIARGFGDYVAIIAILVIFFGFIVIFPVQDAVQNWYVGKHGAIPDRVRPDDLTPPPR